jgi:hypothetical protein
MRKVRFSTPLSFADAVAFVRSNPDVPSSRRASVLSSLRQVEKWLQSARQRCDFVPSDLRLSGPDIEAYAEMLAPAAVGVSRKRIQNALADLRYVVRLASASKGARRRRLKPSIGALEALATDKFRRVQMWRLMTFLSDEGLDPKDVSEEVMLRFKAKLAADLGVRSAKRPWRAAIRCWNAEAANNRLWPKIQLVIPTERQPTTYHWNRFPRSLEAGVDAYFSQRRGNGSLFSELGKPLSSATVKHRKDLLRFAASALVDRGVPANKLRSFRGLCAPGPFKAALQQMVDARQGQVTAVVANAAYVLHNAAKYSGVLSAGEINEVSLAYRNFLAKTKGRSCPRQERDQMVLDKLDDPQLLDALLMLPTRTVRSIERASVSETRQCALKVQFALALELWFCAPVRLKNLVSLNLNKHFVQITRETGKAVLLRVPAEEVKNGVAAEHILSKPAADLLELYVKRYRNLVQSNPRAWLFPNDKGHHKSENTFGTQLTKWVKAEVGIDFHSHLIRKIVTKIYLDGDPGGLEVMRRQLGHKSDEMLRRTYAQRTNRVAQSRYLEALEGRRLSALGPLAFRERKT